MITKYILSFFISLTIIANVVHSQEVLLGQKCPIVNLNNVINYPNRRVSLAEFRGKVLILDFWATWCRACISSFPKLDSLQQQYKAQVQILLVTTESEKEVKGVFSRFESLKGIRLPSVVLDSILNKLFPNKLLPHYVWIDKDGTVRAITSSEHLTKENITSLLAGKFNGLPYKKDNLTYDFRLPILVNDYNNSSRTDYLINSYFSGFKAGIRTVNFIDKDDSGYISSICITNAPITRLYKAAYEKALGFNDSRVILNFSDSARYKNNLYAQENAFCYDLRVNEHRSSQFVFEYFRNQLDLFLGLKSHTDRRAVNCLVLKKIHDVPDLYSKGGTPEFEINKGQMEISVRNLAWWAFIDNLNMVSLIPPYQIIDETGIEEGKKVNLMMSIDFSSLQKIQKSLARFGLTIANELRMVDVIVLESVK
jgi:thiol-disulfide isomerase/thioredoxin